MRIHTGWAVTVLAMCFVVVGDGDAQEVLALGPSGFGALATQSANAGAALDPATLQGQEAVRPAAAGVEASREVAGPTRDGATVGVRAGTVVESSAPLLTAALQRPRTGQSKALMIVGGAALVTGLIIGGDAGALLAVGGAVVGLYGLYQFVR